MITAIVRYKLPPHIDYAACREHFHKIAPGFREAKGLISKHFIWKTVGEIREASDATLLGLPDLGAGSVTSLLETLGLPSCDGVRPLGKKTA